MTQPPTPIHKVVREHYAERIKSNASCCGPQNGAASCCCTDSNLYSADLLATLPEGESASVMAAAIPSRSHHWNLDKPFWISAQAQVWTASLLQRKSAKPGGTTARSYYQVCFTELLAKPGQTFNAGCKQVY